jgi:hypothetical protein
MHHMTLLNILTAIAACIKSKRDKTNSSASQTNKNNTVKVSFLARDRNFFWFNSSSRSFWYMSGIYMGTVRYAHDHAQSVPEMIRSNGTDLQDTATLLNKASHVMLNTNVQYIEVNLEDILILGYSST